MVGLGCMCIGRFALPNAPIATLILMSRTLSIPTFGNVLSWQRLIVLPA